MEFKLCYYELHMYIYIYIYIYIYKLQKKCVDLCGIWKVAQIQYDEVLQNFKKW